MSSSGKFTNQEKYEAIIRTRDDLFGKYIVICEGELLGVFDNRSDAIDFAGAEIPYGVDGIVTEVKEKSHKIKENIGF